MPGTHGTRGYTSRRNIGLITLLEVLLKTRIPVAVLLLKVLFLIMFS